jgi:hypothetical protein
MRSRSLSFGILLLLLITASSLASYLWEPRVRVTDSATGYSALPRHMIPHVGASESFHQIVRHWDRVHNSCNDGVGYYLSATNTTGWAGAWDNAWENRERFTYEPNASGDNGQSAFNTVVDEYDDVHVFYEAKQYATPHAAVEIAYKRSDNDTLWPPGFPPVFVTPSGCGCVAHTPKVFLEPSTRILHVVCGTGTPDSCGHTSPGSETERLYMSKSIAPPEDNWPDPSFIVDPLGGEIVVVNPVVHFFGSIKVEEGIEYDTYHVIHRYGVPPQPLEVWDFTETTTILDVYQKPKPLPIPADLSDAEPLLGLSDSGVLYFVWHRFAEAQGAGGQTKEVYFARVALDANGEPDSCSWWPEHEGGYPWGYCLSRYDDEYSGAASVAVAENGTVHVMYHEPGAGDFNDPGDADFYHIYNTTDPTDTTAWSYRTLVSSDKTTDAKGPHMVVSGDTVYVSFSDYDDDSFDAWFRMGYEIPDTLAGTTVTWSGRVFLDADLYVAADAELKIADGTKVFVTGNHDRLQSGMDPERIELIVAGTLTLEGSSSYPDSFVVFDGTGETDWYGIWLTGEGELNVGYAVMEDAIAAISTPIPQNPSSFVSAIDDKVTFVDCTDTLLFIAPPWEKTTWSSNVSLPVDFLVAPGGSLEIDAGVTVTAEANKDVEIRVDGPLLALGEDDNNRVTFTSNGSSGCWDGIRFIDGSDDTTTSSLEYVEIEYPIIGVQLDSLSGTLFHPTFDQVQTHQIYLDRDTRIPYGCEWNLDAPVKVVVEAGTDFHATGEVDTLVEIVVNGTLKTQRAAPGTDWVEFTSTAKDSFNGDDWYGITIRGDGMTYGVGIADVKYSDIAFAHYPIAFMIADSAAVTDSRFHHYRKDAILDWGSDACIVGNYVHRGDVLDPTIGTGAGRVGIHVANSFGLVEQDTVFYQLDTGIWADFSEGHCELPNPPPIERVLGIWDNVVVGKPTADNTACTGVLIEWVCHERGVWLVNSNIQNWQDSRGVRLNNCSDVVVKCNCIKNNQIGVKHERKYLNMDARNGSNLFRQNNFERNDAHNVKVTHGPGGGVAGMYLGVSGQSTSGENRFVMLDSDTENVRLDVWEHYRVDSAHVNVWYDHNEQLLNNEEAIDETNWFRKEIYEQDIEVTGFLSTDPTCSVGSACDLPVIPPGSVALTRRGEVVAPDGNVSPGAEASSAELQPELPERFALGRPRPNPATGFARIDLDVPRDNRELVDLAIYDVRGRRVRNLIKDVTEAGRYSLCWDLRDASGMRVAAGVYFVRIVSETYSATEKLVLLQ